MVGLYYYDKTYIACFPKIFKDKKEELESNPEKSKEYFRIIFSTIIKYLKEESNNNQNKSVPEYDDLSHELFDNFYFPGIIDKILDSYTRHKLIFPLRKHENVNNWSNIDWNKTIAKSSIFLTDDDFPIFDKVISHNLNEDKEHIVAKIHAMILNEIFDEFGWLFWNRYIPFIPDLKETLLKEQTPYYLKILKEERSKTNIEWKKETINLLINYLEERYLGSPNAKHWLASGDGVFNQIWQKACQVVYGNNLDDKIGNYQLLNNIYSQENKIKNIFEKIEISSTNRNLNNINPDQILIFDKAKKIFILDAKNYKSFEDTNTEIYKQYVYSFYFPKVLSKIKNTRIFNCFLIPHADEPKNDKWNIIDWRKVELPFFHNKSNYKDLNILWKFEISMIKTFEYYLENKEIDLSDFHPENLEKIKDKK